MDKRILVINPGSTSTKLALFQGEQKLFDAAVRHSKEDLSPFSWVMAGPAYRPSAGYPRLHLRPRHRGRDDR